MNESLQIALQSAIDPYVTSRIAEANQASENSFLYGEAGQEFLGLHRLPESQGEMVGYWHYGGNVGNDPGKIGPQGPTASHVWIPGNVSTLKAVGVPKDWANVYFYMKLPTPAVLPKRIVDIRTFQIADLTGWQTLEFQAQISLGGLIHNMAYQCNFARRIWGYFDYTNTDWIYNLPELPIPDFSKPVTLAAEFALDGQSTTHVGLSINGQFYPVGVKQSATVKAVPEKFTTAVQIDTKPGGNCSLSILQTDIRML